MLVSNEKNPPSLWINVNVYDPGFGMNTLHVNAPSQLVGPLLGLYGLFGIPRLTFEPFSSPAPFTPLQMKGVVPPPTRVMFSDATEIFVGDAKVPVPHVCALAGE